MARGILCGLSQTPVTPFRYSEHSLADNHSGIFAGTHLVSARMPQMCSPPRVCYMARSMVRLKQQSSWKNILPSEHYETGEDFSSTDATRTLQSKLTRRSETAEESRAEGYKFVRGRLGGRSWAVDIDELTLPTRKRSI